MSAPYSFLKGLIDLSWWFNELFKKNGHRGHDVALSRGQGKTQKAEGGGQLIPFLGQGRGGAPMLFFKGGNYQQASLVQGQLPIVRETGPDAPGRADDHRLAASEQKAEAFLFHGG